MELKQLRSSIPLIQILDLYQRIRHEESCDTHIYCQDGYVPCHRFVLMANSAFLNQLIMDNLNEIGHKDTTAVISLSLPDFKTRHVALLISMFYTGKVVFAIKDLYYVDQLLKMLVIGDLTRTLATEAEISSYYRPRYIIDNIPDSDSDDEGDHAKYTTNVFTASKQLQLATSGKNYQSKTNENSRKDTNTTVPGLITDCPPNVDAIDHLNSTSNCSFNVEPQRGTPKVTPINIHALMKRKARKRTRKNNEESVIVDIGKKRRSQAKLKQPNSQTVYGTRSRSRIFPFVPPDAGNLSRDHVSTSGEYSQPSSSNSVQPYVFRQRNSRDFPFDAVFVAGKYLWKENNGKGNPKKKNAKGNPKKKNAKGNPKKKIAKGNPKKKNAKGNRKKNNLTDLNKPSTFTAAMSEMTVNNLDSSLSEPTNSLVPQIPELSTYSSDVLNGNENGLSQNVEKYDISASSSMMENSLFCSIETFENQGLVAE